jgi:hypothetical protein
MGDDLGSPETRDVLKIVEKQIDEIRHELDVQMKRIWILQQQLDELSAKVSRLDSK